MLSLMEARRINRGLVELNFEITRRKLTTLFSGYQGVDNGVSPVLTKQLEIISGKLSTRCIVINSVAKIQQLMIGCFWSDLGLPYPLAFHHTPLDMLQ
ncbi:hypothetical protein KQX54_015492 [Cotesia glomerata]|uniref:Uncharacterized protein n=1 Tax=Cotesia glomerata TaxID=32391 RepID=A0AAV7IT50_COTGL|nr:hypothetical protein KQX54_015492 [Cotesia glomerata]